MSNLNLLKIKICRNSQQSPPIHSQHHPINHSRQPSDQNLNLIV